MKYIIGKNRTQFEMFCLDEHIDKDNEVRMIEFFVDSLPLSAYGFIEQKANPQGGSQPIIQTFPYLKLNARSQPISSSCPMKNHLKNRNTLKIP